MLSLMVTLMAVQPGTDIQGGYDKPAKTEPVKVAAPSPVYAVPLETPQPVVQMMTYQAYQPVPVMMPQTTCYGPNCPQQQPVQQVGPFRRWFR